MISRRRVLEDLVIFSSHGGRTPGCTPMGVTCGRTLCDPCARYTRVTRASRIDTCAGSSSMRW